MVTAPNAAKRGPYSQKQRSDATPESPPFERVRRQDDGSTCARPLALRNG
jgi:hypothetical protein